MSFLMMLMKNMENRAVADTKLKASNGEWPIVSIMAPTPRSLCTVCDELAP